MSRYIMIHICTVHMSIECLVVSCLQEKASQTEVYHFINDKHTSKTAKTINHSILVIVCHCMSLVFLST